MKTVPATELRSQTRTSVQESTARSDIPLPQGVVGPEFGARNYWPEKRLSYEPSRLERTVFNTETKVWRIQVTEPVTIMSPSGWLVVGAIIIETVTKDEEPSRVTVTVRGTNGQNDHLEGRWDNTGVPARHSDAHNDFFAQPLEMIPDWVAEIVERYTGAAL